MGGSYAPLPLPVVTDQLRARYPATFRLAGQGDRTAVAWVQGYQRAYANPNVVGTAPRVPNPFYAGMTAAIRDLRR